MNDDSEKGLLQDKVLQQTFCFLDIDLSMAVKNRLKITGNNTNQMIHILCWQFPMVKFSN